MRLIEIESALFLLLTCIGSWRTGYETCHQSRSVFVTSRWGWNKSAVSGCSKKHSWHPPR